MSTSKPGQLSTLERPSRWWRYPAVAAVILLVVLLLSGCASPGVFKDCDTAEATGIGVFVASIFMPMPLGDLAVGVPMNCPVGSQPENRPPQPPIEVDDRSTPVWEKK